jgi:predicted permease
MTFDRLIADLRFARRALLSAPGFSIVAVLTLAVAIGANTALFSALQAVVLKPLPYPDPDRLVMIVGINRERNFDAPAISWAKYEAFRTRSDVFSELAMYAGNGFTLTEGRGDPEQVAGLHASASFLPLLGLVPARGRHFTPEEDRDHGPPLAMISTQLWRTRFSSDPSILGRTLLIDGVAREIVGVLPARMPVPFQNVAVIVPQPQNLPYLPAGQRHHAIVHACLARLAPGVSLAQATARLAAMSAQFKLDHPQHLDANNHNEPRPLATQVLGDLDHTFWTLAGAVAAVLLIACANLANLFLARVSARQKEIAIRLSLGARPAEIIRQFLTESLVFALAAGALGVLLAWWSLQGIQALAGPQLPRADEIALDARVFAFSLAVSILAGLAVGLYPAWQAARTDVQGVLKDNVRGTLGATGSRGFRQLLVITQVALSLTLLICAGLLVASFHRLQTAELGFGTAGRAFGVINLPQTRYGTPEASREFFRQLQQKLDSAPELAGGGAIFGLPLAGTGSISPYAIQGRPFLPLHERPLASVRFVTPGYFKTMGIRLRAGRGFTADDRFGGENVAVINESFARKLFPGESPLQASFVIGPHSDVAVRIVGVIRDVKAAGPGEPPPDEIYYPRDQRGNAFMTVVGQARPGLAAAAVIPVLRRILGELDPTLALANADTLDQLVAQSLGVPRLTMALLICFAVLAALLAAVGVYSVISYTVAQRTGELGVRLALGASAPDIVRTVAAAAAVQVFLGLALGLAGAAATTVLLRQALYEVRPFEPAIYAGVAAAFAAIAAAACLVPTRRALRIDPMIALRTE